MTREYNPLRADGKLVLVELYGDPRASDDEVEQVLFTVIPRHEQYILYSASILKAIELAERYVPQGSSRSWSILIGAMWFVGDAFHQNGLALPMKFHTVFLYKRTGTLEEPDAWCLLGAVDDT